MILRFLLLFLAFSFDTKFSYATPSNNACTVFLSELLKPNVRNRDAVFYERVVAPLESVAQVLKDSKTGKQAASALLQMDYRQNVFKLEALARFYDGESWAKNLTMYRDKIKRFEDLLGAAVDTGKLPKKVEKLGLKLPPKAQAYIEKDAQQKLSDLAKLLEADGWIGKDGGLIEEFLGKIKKIDTPRQAETSEYILERLHDDAKAIMNAKLDMKDLQGGVHELRRKLRWILIDIHSHRGQIEIVKNAKTSSKLAPFTKVSEESKKFLEFDKTAFTLKNTVKFGEDEYLALSYFVERFGEIKDTGEIRERLLHALVESKAFPTEQKADEWLVPYLKSEIGWKEHYEDAQKTYDDLISSGLLKSIP